MQYNNRQTRTAMRKRKQRRRFIIFLTALTITLIIFAVLLLKPNSENKTADTLNGVWVYDQYTKYEFDGFGEGCMCLEDTHYEYSYIIDKNTISIDFKNESVHDCEYTFEITDNTLMLVGGKGTTGGTYKLNKVNN